MSTIRQFVHNWMLAGGILIGILAYLLYAALPLSQSIRAVTHDIIAFVQPVLLFLMLFLTFCKVRPGDLRPHKWHLWLLLLQSAFWILGGVVLIFLPLGEYAILVESAMLCFICPTATACAVVTGKLGGDQASVLTYTILINIIAAILIPAVVPLIHPLEAVSFFTDFWLILGKVFPLLICPALLAWIVRYYLPAFHKWLLNFPDLAFYIWGVCLMLAIAVSCNAIAHCGLSLKMGVCMATISLLCCALQFFTGKTIGAKYGDAVSAGQALGQKNTVFAIWMGYTFLTPVTSIVGGFYSLWHNIYNSWQLARRR